MFPPVLHTCAKCNTKSLCFTEMMSLMYPNVTVNTSLNQYSNYHECTTICTTDNTVIHLFYIHLLQAGGSNTLYKINLPKSVRINRERDCVAFLSFSPHVCSQLPLNRFSWKLILGSSMKSHWDNANLGKVWQNTWRCTWTSRTFIMTPET